ncbi:MAG: ketose-bisphosphate aldolase [Firmicutes bacterium]|nr:ketose-bisphosphate aldolase [Bacillota bacterium]
MSLVNPLYLIKQAQKKGIAIPAFNIHNMETVQGVIEAAVEEKSPVMIATTPGTLRHAGVSCIANIVKTIATEVNIPVALHLDHCSSYGVIVQALRNGYTSVMIDAAELPYEGNVSLVKEVVKMAHAVGVAVEAEIGRIGGTEDDLSVDEREASLTIPAEAKDFMEATGIDTLAIAIGTAHGMYQGEPKLDFNRLSAIKELVEIPLVLHGASGVSDDSVREAIKRGISKVNIATELKIPLARSIQKYFTDNPEGNDPRKYLGLGREAVKKVVKEKIRLCGSNNLSAILEEYKCY